MARNRQHDGAHRSHCCWYHHCKYGDDDCPVVTGEIKQDSTCEDCGLEGWRGIPPRELMQIDKEIGDLLFKWHEEAGINDRKEVVQTIADKRDYRYTFWFVAKLAECNRIGNVWEFTKLYKALRERKQDERRQSRPA